MEKGKERGRTHPDSERIPSMRRVCVCEYTNPITDGNNTIGIIRSIRKDHFIALRYYVVGRTKEICVKINIINISRKYLHATHQVQHIYIRKLVEGIKVGKWRSRNSQQDQSFVQESYRDDGRLHFSRN